MKKVIERFKVEVKYSVSENKTGHLLWKSDLKNIFNKKRLPFGQPLKVL